MASFSKRVEAEGDVAFGVQVGQGVVQDLFLFLFTYVRCVDDDIGQGLESLERNLLVFNQIVYGILLIHDWGQVNVQAYLDQFRLDIGHSVLWDVFLEKSQFARKVEKELANFVDLS